MTHGQTPVFPRHDILPPQEHAFVCPRCFGFKQESYAYCYRCKGDFPLDAFLPISYGWQTGPEYSLHTLIRTAKSQTSRHYEWSVGPSQRAYAYARLFVALASFVERHERCLWRAAGLGDLESDLGPPWQALTNGFPTVMAVPPSSLDDRYPWPFPTLVGLVPYFSGRVCRGLQPTAKSASEARSVDSERFAASWPAGAVEGKTVLLVDDVWTTGSTLKSCAQLVRSGGATKVVGLVVERYLDPDWRDTKPHMPLVHSHSLAAGSCVLCARSSID